MNTVADIIGFFTLALQNKDDPLESIFFCGQRKSGKFVTGALTAPGHGVEMVGLVEQLKHNLQERIRTEWWDKIGEE